MIIFWLLFLQCTGFVVYRVRRRRPALLLPALVPVQRHHEGLRSCRGSERHYRCVRAALQRRQFIPVISTPNKRLTARLKSRDFSRRRLAASGPHLPQSGWQ